MTDGTPTGAGPRSPDGRAPASLPAPSVSFFLIALGRRAQESVEARLREHGLAYHHLSALGHLRRQPGLSYSELARRARVTVQSMQTTAGHLEHLGLVERGATTSKGRRADLHVTPDGLQVLAVADAAFRSADDELLGDISAEERVTLASTLLRLFPVGPPGSEAVKPTT